MIIILFPVYQLINIFDEIKFGMDIIDLKSKISKINVIEIKKQDHNLFILPCFFYLYKCFFAKSTKALVESSTKFFVPSARFPSSSKSV